MALRRPSLYRPRHSFWHFFLTYTSHSSHSPWPSSTRAKKAWHSPEGLSQSWAAGIWGSSLQFCSVLAAPFSLAPATLNSAFLLPASLRIQYRGALCCEYRHTPLGVHTHPHFYKPLKETRPKAERGADASQMLGLASCAT